MDAPKACDWSHVLDPLARQVTTLLGQRSAVRGGHLVREECRVYCVIGCAMRDG